MSSKLHRGALIVFEGLDRTGKSTQSKRLVENLTEKGFRTRLIRFPDRSTPIGTLIGDYMTDRTLNLDDRAVHLLFTANRFEKLSELKSLLHDNVHVVVDRYSFSGIVYSAAKKGMDARWCRAPEAGLPRPDVVYFLELSSEEARRRPGFGAERYEDEKTQVRVLEEYRKLSEEFKFRHVDASRSPEEVGVEILEDCERVIERCKGTPLGYLE